MAQLSHQHGVDAYAIDLPGFGTAYHEPIASLDGVLDFIVEQLPEKSVLCGWSLGGMLAVQLAARWPGRVAGIVTLGSNLHFTQTETWHGMPEKDYQQFCERFAAQPEKTWRRFLQQQTRGDDNAQTATAVLELLADFSDVNAATASRALALLGEIDNRAAFSALSLPGAHMLAACDSITPIATLDAMLQLNSKQTVQALAGCGHAMFLSQPNRVAQHISDFVNGIPYALDKQRVARSFSRAAQSYDGAAQLQRDVGERLCGLLPAAPYKLAADIGCGTGFVTQEIAKKSAQTLGVDIAPGMLQAAREAVVAPIVFVQADMGNLPLASGSADVLVCNLAVQWSEDVAHTFREWRRVLAAQGSLVFSSFLPGTLCELESSWQAVDDAVHVNRFASAELIAAALREAGFVHVSIQTERRVCFYENVRALVRALKAIGAHNMNAGQTQGLTGKNRWQQFVSRYEKYRQTMGLPVTYEVIYVVAS